MGKVELFDPEDWRDNQLSQVPHLKVMIALRLVLVPSTQPLGKAALPGLPQLISVQAGWLPLHSLPASHVLNITDYSQRNIVTLVTLVMFSNDLITRVLHSHWSRSLQILRSDWLMGS